MKLATYNIWNHAATMETRLDAICEELVQVDADWIALQEVPAKLTSASDQLFMEYITQRTGYPYARFQAYPGDDEGLGFLSRCR